MSQPTLSQLGFREGLAPSDISFEKFPSVVIPSLNRTELGDSIAPAVLPHGIVVAPNLVADRRNAEACSRHSGHASERVTELLVSSRELYPFDAIGGVVLRLVFVGGPDLGFFLSELGNPTFLELVSVCTQMFGIPVLADPKYRARR